MICKLCGKSFKIHTVIDGKERNLSKRKYCTECSPFGFHNTAKILVASGEGVKQCPKCGKIKPYKEFHSLETRSRGSSYCKDCARVESVNRLRRNKQENVDYKGGKCERCGYDKCLDALEFHHKNPEEKDINFKRMRGWKKERREKELDKCVLLCSNCHREEHSRK